MSCPLCDMEQITHWYFLDPLWIICDCKSCKTPMLVYRLHGKEPSLEEKRAMLNLARQVLNKSNLVFRGYMRTVKDHWHEHLVEVG